MMLPLTLPPLAAAVPPWLVPATAAPLAEDFALAPEPVPPAWVLLVVAVFCDALVLWFVVALGLIVTVLFGIALKFASVLTVVFAVGAVD